jgi:precorrin-6B methylase 2
MEDKRTQVIIAHYEEDLEWLKCLDPKKYNIFVYDKGPSSGYPNAKRLENLGREGHTYLTHIVDNYDNLSEIVVFLQGTIIDHLDENDPRCEEDREPADHRINMFVEMLINTARVSGRSANAGVHMEGPWSAGNGFRIPGSPETMGEWFERMTNTRFEGCPAWYKNALFAVRRDYVKRRPLTVYKRMQNEMTSHGVHPYCGHYLERGWYVLLGPNDQRLIPTMENMLDSVISNSFEFTNNHMTGREAIWQGVMGRLVADAPLHFLDVGCMEGCLAAYLLAFSLKHPEAKITCLDEYSYKEAGMYRRLRSNMRLLPANRLNLIKGSIEGSLRRLKQQAHIVCINGNRFDEKEMFKMTLLSLKNLKPNGAMIWVSCDKNTTPAPGKLVLSTLSLLGLDIKYMDKVLTVAKFQDTV